MSTRFLFALSIAALGFGCSQADDGASTPAVKAKAASTPTTKASTAMDAAQSNGSADVHALTVETLDGKKVALSSYKGKALLIVNTASQCGYTPQYASLQKLYATYKDQGLEVLAFPSNDFGAQEPGTAAEIQTFVDDKYNVEFRMFAKLHATGGDKAPLYKALTEETGNGISGDVKWNFTKFLVDPNGKVMARFESKVDPMSPELVNAVKAAIPKS